MMPEPLPEISQRLLPASSQANTSGGLASMILRAISIACRVWSELILMLSLASMNTDAVGVEQTADPVDRVGGLTHRQADREAGLVQLLRATRHRRPRSTCRSWPCRISTRRPGTSPADRCRRAPCRGRGASSTASPGCRSRSERRATRLCSWRDIRRPG